MLALGEVDEARRCSSGIGIEVLRLLEGEVIVAERSGIGAVESRSLVNDLRDDLPDLCLSRSLDLGEPRSRSRTLVEGICKTVLQMC